MNFRKVTWSVLRLSMAFIFLWAFVDKLLGLGMSTAKGVGMIAGGSPTASFLTARAGTFAEFFQSLNAYQPYIDWVFMAGLLGVGLTLLLNRFVVWGAVAGGVMMILMYLASFPPPANPVVDSHVIYLLVLILLGMRSRDQGHY